MGGGRRHGAAAGAVNLAATPQKERFEKATRRAVWHELGVKIECTTARPTATRTIIEMEQHGISHRELEGFKALAPTWWIPARRQISQKRQAIIAEAKRVFQIRELPQGYATQVVPLMKQVWSAYL